MDMRLIGLALTACLLAGCATQSNSAASPASERDMRKVPLVSSGNPQLGAADYDRDAGRCSAGSALVMSPDEVNRLIDEWRTGPESAECVAIEKGKMPSSGDYPEAFARLQQSGSADVLVRVEKDGTVESAHAVCVTDTAFGKAAEATVMKMRFSPQTCDGTPVRGAILLPLSYDWK